MKNSNEKDNGAIFRLGFFRIVSRLVSRGHRFNLYFEQFTLTAYKVIPREVARSIVKSILNIF